MLDRLMPVGGQRTRWPAELPVEVDSGGEGEYPRGHAADEPCGCLGQVTLEAELLLERVDDRLDSLPHAPERRRGSLGLVRAARAQEQPAQLRDALLEVGSGEALVREHELADGRLSAEQLEHRLPFSRVGGDKV